MLKEDSELRDIREKKTHQCAVTSSNNPRPAAPFSKIRKQETNFQKVRSGNAEPGFRQFDIY